MRVRASQAAELPARPAAARANHRRSVAGGIRPAEGADTRQAEADTRTAEGIHKDTDMDTDIRARVESLRVATIPAEERA